MLRINLSNCALICAIVLTVTNTILGQKTSFFRKPWPTYSLQNMPQTRFTCHDKILGGYYADPETQCQMFHVCVKVAGVGVQDFRFLCPNSTAFDQEAQICADWGDVDCEQSVLYYGSDNFDLYRLGSGFESKRAPLAEEDESTFHLQRAENGDVRRYKETRVDQKSRPEQPPNYTKHFETVTRGTFSSGSVGGSSGGNNNYLSDVPKKPKTEVTKKAIVSYYTPTSTTTTTTERYTNDDSKQDLDDIFKGSHSSHFFSNRNGGREDDFVDHPVRQQKPNDFNDFSKKSEATTSGKTRVTPSRSKRPQQSTTTYATSTTTTTTTTAAPKVTKKVTAHTSYSSDFYDYALFKSTSASSTPSTTTTRLTTPKPSTHSAVNRFNFNFNDYQTQANIQPTTYNPNRYKNTTPKYTEVNREKSVNNEAFNKKLQKFEQTQQQRVPTTQNATFVQLNEFSEFAKIKTQPPQPFQPKAPSKTFEAPRKADIEPQYHRSRGPAARVHNQQPEPFKVAPQRHSPSATTSTTTKVVEKVKEKPTVHPDHKPRGFVSRGSINYKATTQRNSETYPTISANNYKKFSTLVPKDKYDPTTFKPSTYKKPYENTYYQTQQTIKPHNQPQKSVTSLATTTVYTTPNPYYNADEDDGQYHPELYELDFPRKKLNLARSTTTAPLATSRSTTTTSTTTAKPYYQQPYQNPASHLKSQQQTSFLKEQSSLNNDFSDEDELFKTAQSLNFGAASINKLRADIFKAEKTSQQYNSHYNPLNSLTSPKTTTTTPASTTTTYFTYPSYSSLATQQTTARPTPYAATLLSSTAAVTSTTRRPTTTSTTTTTTTITNRPTTPFPVHITKSGKHAEKSDKKSKKNENKKKTSKRPPHADEDTSYDYAYYDSDTLSESPQEYPEYEIQEFTKTRKN